MPKKDPLLELDPRISYILNIVETFFHCSSDDQREISDAPEITDFLDDPYCRVLCLRQHAQNPISLSRLVIFEDDDTAALVFHKTSPEPITESTMRQKICFVNLVDSPVSTFHYNLTNVFKPTINDSQFWSRRLDPKLQSCMSELTAGLDFTVNKNFGAFNNVKDVYTVDDELDLWTYHQESRGSSVEARAVKSVRDIVADISRELHQCVDVNSGTDFLDGIQMSLQQLWGLGEESYPQARLIHLLDLIGTQVTQIVQNGIKHIKIWTDSYSKVESELSWGIEICAKVNDLCLKCTRTTWPRFDPSWRPYTLDEYIPAATSRYVKRLQEILRVRSVHREITYLVPISECPSLHPKRAFGPFQAVNLIFSNCHTDKAFEDAVTEFDHGLIPAEAKLSIKLREKLGAKLSNAQLMLEFKRYAQLIERPKVAHDVQSQREQMLIIYRLGMKGYLEEIESGDYSAIGGLNSAEVNDIFNMRQIYFKGKELEEIGKKTMADLDDYESLEKLFKEFGSWVVQLQEKLYSDWKKGVNEDVLEEGLALKDGTPVIDFNQDNNFMEVNYSKKLQGLIGDASQLTLMGFRLTEDVSLIVHKAGFFVKQANELDQIASFHNTIGDRMVRSQRPMMLDTALALSELVSSQHSVSWNSVDQVESYIRNFRSIVRRLSRQNNYLCQIHEDIVTKVETLFGLDVAGESRWELTVGEILKIFSNVEAEGYRSIKSWRNHWNHQIYKGLEAAYRHALSVINTKLPPITIEIIYSQQTLQFKPALEDVTALYVAHIQRFLSIPQHFKGINTGDEESKLFGSVTKCNANLFQGIYAKSFLLVKTVSRGRDKYDKWVAIGSADVGSLCDLHLRTASDWDRNFKDCRANVIESGRVQFLEEFLPPFKISSKSLRLDVDSMNRKYFETLGDTLLVSTNSEVSAIESFLKAAVRALDVTPVSADDIISAVDILQIIHYAESHVTRTYESILAKNKVIMTWVKSQVDTMSIQKLMMNYQSLARSFDALILRQVDSVRAQLEGEFESLKKTVSKFKGQWDLLQGKGGEGKAEMSQIMKFINEQQADWVKITGMNDRITQISKKLNLPVRILPAVEEIEREITLCEEIWVQVDSFNLGLKKFQAESWLTFRNSQIPFEEFLVKWIEEFEAAKENGIIGNILTEIKSYQKFLPNIKYIRGDAFAEKHWTELYQILKIPPRPFSTLTFGDFLAVRAEIEGNFKELKTLNRNAAGEVTVRQALDELDSWETEAQFTFVQNLDSAKKVVMIIYDFKGILNKIGDNQSLLQSIKSSPFYSKFADRINSWEVKMADLDLYLTSLSKIQRRWIYLEPVFSHGVLDNEQTRFSRIDKDFRAILVSIGHSNRVTTLQRIHGIRGILSNMLDQLGRCQNSLNEFLERKRSGFPRFYFLGDDDLLEILGQSTKPSVIQSHLKKLFGGIHNVDFDPGFETITAMKSQEGEIVELRQAVKIRPNVEEWLSELSQEMKSTLKSLTLDCVSQKRNRKQDPDAFPSQILTLCNYISFTSRCEENIRNGKLDSFVTELRSELESYTGAQIDRDHPNRKIIELKLKDLILDCIHQIDTVEVLKSVQLVAVTDFVWQKQLRFYLTDDGNVSVRMADAEFAYSYEYQGNAAKLVHTPLTNKCYLTLTQAMRLGLGGNPFGPAGTGKTESVKALGGLLGRQVLVFNCDEGIDVKAMGRIFIGLIKCGAWGCFDEFNRLDAATLSAVSMQIQPIQSALKYGDKSVHLLDETVPLDPNTGIFVTLNPAGKGYGGRNELPDNLKQLFRPVAMTSPNYDQISEVILYTEGFKNAKRLGNKLVEIFNLASGLLTPQKHYDWGLRALKTVLKGCGNTLRTFRDQGVTMGEADEVDIVVSALRLNTLPKLPYEDTRRFNSLIKDSFGDVVFKDLGHDELEQSVRASFDDLKLHLNENQVRKCLQLFEQLEQRMGVVIVGPPLSGKSTICSILKHALNRMSIVVKTSTINPKAMLKSQLLGHINVDTRQWSDGVLTLKAQEVYNERDDIRSWIICDGDIDPEWIESLNSVLDDNRMLTLPSGWRIKFGPNVNFVFETHDLSYASPATVSRMGMILTSEEDADIKGVIASWLVTQPATSRSKTEALIGQFFHRGLDWISNCDTTNRIPLVSIVQNGLSHLGGVVGVAMMAVAMVRGLGCHLEPDIKLQFTKAVLDWMDLRVDGNLANVTLLDDRLGCFDDLDTHDPVDLSVTARPLVKTANVKQTLAQIDPWLRNSESFLLAGTEGCGKTMILEHAFGEVRDVEIATIHCSSLITPQHLLQKMSQVCISKSSGAGREYLAKSKGRLILYFKDLNLVKPDKWGTCQLVEFLHQVITHQGFYDPNLEWVWLKNVQIVASITLGTSDGRYRLSPRFTSAIHYCTVTEPLREQLQVIYRTYLTLCLNSTHPTSPIVTPDIVNKVVLAMISVYENVTKTFPRAKQNHYQFTSRDLTNWVFGMMRYELDGGENPVTEFVQIWAYEACRLFRDRLVSADERSSFDDILETVMKSVWALTSTEFRSQSDLYFISSYAQLAASSSSIGVGTVKPEKTVRLSRATVTTVEAAVEKGMAQFARDYRTLNIVIFNEVLENVTHFDRILSAPCSSLVLTGRAGIGRRTALSIVASLHTATLLTLKVGQDYGVKQFKKDLKTAIRLSAIEGTKVFLVVEDYQLVDEVFLDMLNGLLSSGEVPSLYSPEELETVMGTLREIADDQGHTSSLMTFFTKRIKDLLHVILIMDYTNNSFQTNCERNPALYKNCSLLWLDSWCSESLQQIPRLIISKFYGDKVPNVDDNENNQLMDAFRTFYTSVSTQLASPRRYIAFVHTYGLIYVTKREKIETKIAELKAGVQKLDEARAVVQNLRTDASAQEVILAGKKEQTSKDWDAIMVGMQTTHAQEAHVRELQTKTVAENEIMLAKKQSIDHELQNIQPMLEQAQMSVGNLSNDALIEIRSLRAPPETIKDILVGVLSLMGIQDTSWTSMKAFLGRRGVKEEMRNFDSKKIKPADRKGVEDILKKRASSFDPENAIRASRAAAPLASWVIANVKYSQVLERIEPLMTQQSRLETNLSNAKSQIEELTLEKRRVSEENERLKADLEVTNKEVAELEVTLGKVKKTLASAETLVEKLQDEFVRWTAESSLLAAELDSLPLKCILAAAFITYLCDADETERLTYLKSWSHVVSDQDPFDFCQFMSTEQEMLSFQNLGLPSDRLSQENAIMIMQKADTSTGTSLRPYLIDPSSRATEWLKAYLQKHGYATVNISLRDTKFPHELELAVRFGKALIIHEMDEIDPILMPILRGDLVSQGSRDTIQIGEKVVDYNSDFKLFMTTRNPSPVLPPDSAAVVTIVNFTTTRAGLTTQLLSTTLSFEKPEFETRKTELLRQTDEMKQDLSQLGTQLLKELAGATGNILENQDLLNSLQQTKRKSNEINESLAQKKTVEETLNKEINIYLPLAEFGSLLFFAIVDVPKLNRLYKFSLSCFINLFRKTLGIRYVREGKQSTQKRIGSLKTSLEQLVYEYVCQSLFKGDRLAFAIHLTHTMHSDAFGTQEWDLFMGRLSGGQASDVPSWIPEDRRSAVALLQTQFSDYYRKLNLDNEMDWVNFMSTTECENAVPSRLDEGLSTFQVLLTIQALRPDRLFTAMSTFAKTTLKRKSLFPSSKSFREILDDTMAKEPILILIASGADPSQELRELGVAAVGAKNYAEISMGKEDPAMVLDKIMEASQTGSWLCLKNLHLVTHWLDALEKKIQTIKPHQDFRLWLTSEPHDNFPTILAETCLKVAYESPEGLKKNLERTYTNWSKEYVTEDRNLLRMQALFVLAFFHAIVQERRTYIPQGWSKFYEFNESDLRAGAEILDNLFKTSKGKKIQWSYIRGVYENAIYGGRVDNEFDLRILVSYLDHFFNDNILTGSSVPKQTVAPGVILPLRENYQDFLKILDTFPDYDRPSMFGLPVNIERSWQRTTSWLVINQLKNMGRQFLQAQFHTSVWSNEMNPILGMWRKINQTNSTTNFLTTKSSTALQPRDKSEEEADPLENFVMLEQHNILDLHQFVHKTLANVSKIGRGHVAPTAEMMEVFKALSKREVPSLWSRIWEGPQDTKAYLNGVVTKVVSIQSWWTLVQQDKLLTVPLNLADLLNPVSFLSAFKQHCARKQSICMDELALVCFWKRTALRGGIPSCRLTGLYLEGCTFDGSKLTENTAESPHISTVPDCTIAWVPKSTVGDYRKGGTLSVPLYYNDLRQKLITCLEIPTEGPKSKWIQTGLGLFLKTI